MKQQSVVQGVLLLTYVASWPLVEPSTATVLGQVSSCALEDFQKAIVSADAAQKEFWTNTTAAQRGGMLRRWYDLIMANVDDCM